MVLYQNNKNNSGFTLLETLIATIILGVALVPIVSLFIANLNNYRRAGEKSQLVAAATGIMEEIIANKNYVVRTESRESYAGLTPTRGNRELRYNVTVETYPPLQGSGAPPTLLIKITVATYWNTAPDRTVSVTTIRRLN